MRPAQTISTLIVAEAKVAQASPPISLGSEMERASGCAMGADLFD
jgi:hypothetical protein